MRRKILVGIIGLAVVAALAAGTLYYLLFKADCVVRPGSLYVRSSVGYGAVVEDTLRRHIRHMGLFKQYARHLKLEDSVKAGHYLLKSGMSVVEVARMLKLGLQTPVRVTINNVRTPAQLAGKLARQLEADSVTLFHALTSPRLAQAVGFDSLTLFSMFIPDTYEFYWTVTPEAFLKRMRREYDRFWTKERDARRQRSGLSRLEVMTLASIVYEETRKSDEMPRVAGVYVRRSNMPCRISDCGVFSIVISNIRPPTIPILIRDCRPRPSACPDATPSMPSSTSRSTITCFSAPVRPSTATTTSP